jgi:hypothetical protein
MTASDRPAFAELMLGIGEAYGESVSDARMEIYFAALADLSLERLRQAATVHVRASKFFPRVSELREALDGPPEDRAEIAWNATLELVRRVGYWRKPAWPDPVMEIAAMELFGGWQSLCERLPADGPGLTAAAKQFKAAYIAYSRRELRRPALMPPSKEEAARRLASLEEELAARGLPAPGLQKSKAKVRA